MQDVSKVLFALLRAHFNTSCTAGRDCLMWIGRRWAGAGCCPPRTSPAQPTENINLAFHHCLLLRCQGCKHSWPGLLRYVPYGRGSLHVDPGLAGADGLLPSTYLSVKANWSFGLAFVNGFNLVRHPDPYTAVAGVCAVLSYLKLSPLGCFPHAGFTETRRSCGSVTWLLLGSFTGHLKLKRGCLWVCAV